MRLHIFFLVALGSLAVLTGDLRAITNVFEYPLVFPRHRQLTIEFQQAIGQKEKDLAGMERVCRAGVALLPENASWRYNLACALTLQKRSADALTALDRAVDLGFRDETLIAQDEDLADLRALPAFRAILSKARALRDKPVAGQPIVTATPIVGDTAWVSASNTIWDLESGNFRAFFAPRTNAPPPAELAARWNGPAASSIRGWMAGNSAAGNVGDFYDNRDDGHSRLDVKPFQGLTAIQYASDARQTFGAYQGAHYGLASFLFNGVTIGNSSVALTSGPYWRSVPRNALVDGPATAFLFTQYLSNHLYCYPAHRDHDASGLGDLYPVNQPYVLISQGSSGSDQPFLQAIAATLASFQPATKQFLISTRLVMPTVQMLLRASQKTVTRPEDYLSGQAHPTVFDAATLDVERLVRMAHELTTNDIPPVVALRTIRDTRAQPGIDFFDLAGGDALYDTPCVIGRIMRGSACRRTLAVRAQLTGVPADGWQLRWVLLRGDPRKVTLRSTTPDPTLDEEISVAYHGGRFPVAPGLPLQSSRVDIGVFATNGRLYSAPSFVSFLHLDNEVRAYSEDGRILSIDYSAAATNHYVDPLISCAKNWRDEYQYDADKRLTGWTRRRGGISEAFNPRGERVEQTDRRGRATVTRTVSYLPRSTPNNGQAPTLVQVDGDWRIRYRYRSDQDPVGEIVGRERVGP